MTLLTPLASSMFAPGVPEVLKDFDTNSTTLATFVVSVYLLGFAMGPLVVAPCSELYGRLTTYHVCNVCFICWTVGCALATNMNMLIGFRFMAGCFGVAPITNGGGTIADLMAPEKRGGAMAIWAMGPLLGPVIGPVAGGFLAKAEGWRWIFWVIAIALGVTTAAAFVVMRETYGPAILAAKAKKLRKETGNMNLRSRLDQQLPAKELFVRAVVRPAKLMFLSPICAAMSLYMAVVYGILYLLFTTFTFVFEDDYGFSESTVGLVYIGMGIGMLLGLLILGVFSDPLMKRLSNKHNEGKLKPEYRLPMLMYAGPFIPAGLFIYGWTAQNNVSHTLRCSGEVALHVERMLTCADSMGSTTPGYAFCRRWSDRCLYVHQHIPCGHLYPLRCLRHGRQHRPTIHFWLRLPPFRPPDEQCAWSRMVKQPSGLHLARSLPDTLAVLLVR